MAIFIFQKLIEYFLIQRPGKAENWIEILKFLYFFSHANCKLDYKNEALKTYNFIIIKSKRWCYSNIMSYSYQQTCREKMLFMIFKLQMWCSNISNEIYRKSSRLQMWRNWRCESGIRWNSLVLSAVVFKHDIVSNPSACANL